MKPEPETAKADFLAPAQRAFSKVAKKLGLPSVSCIEDCLRLTSLDENEIQQRAPLLAEDIERIGFESFRLSVQTYPYLDLDSGDVAPKPLPEYHFGETGFSVHKAVNPFDDRPTWFGGAGLDRGHLQFFSKVSRIAHHVIPEIWLNSAKLRANLRNPTQHLDTLEEIWWLARWQRLKRSGIRMSQKLCRSALSDVDWQLELPGIELTVNLEVKRLKFDVVRVRQGRQFDAHRFANFCESDVLPKFRISADREVNVLALTIFGEVDQQVNEVISAWLAAESRAIDAILVTAHHPLGGGLFYLHFANPKARELETQLNSPDSEDNGMWFPIELTYDIPGLPLPYRR